MSKILVLKPRMSEQTYAQSSQGVYVFNVPTTANKHTVKAAIEQQFAVSVVAVRIANGKGKPKRFVSGKGRTVSRGHRTGYKKAYATLKKDQHIPIFASLEEAAKDATEPKTKTEKK